MADDSHQPHANAAASRLSVFDLTPDTLAAWLARHGEPVYRARQTLHWVYGRDATGFGQMTSLPRGLRAMLAEGLEVYRSRIVARRESRDGTIKLLLRWPDGATSECVMIPDGDRRTACLSTQVGCPVRCSFCASGIGGLQRQLSAGEIVDQAMRVRELCAGGARLSNVVFMGLGEPLANYDATVQAIRTINADWAMGIGARRITVSTVGLVDRMRRLADEGLQITLALSLHAPTDELRKTLIPWAEFVTIESLIEAANYFFDRTGREVTLEYILLRDVNDSESLARRLATVAGRMRSHVNLIVYNPVEDLPYRRPSSQTARRFLEVLRSAGVNAHARPSRGLDIEAACGQLRRRNETAAGRRPEDAQDIGR
ncbi:MAG: 23S rRNA (adenine(2503)-C(2))-methyltransferase RlmN [Phycisphaerae bacterium]